MRGGKVKGGHTEGEQILFDLLQLKGLKGEIARKKERKKKEKREGAVTLKPLSLAIKLLQ